MNRIATLIVFSGIFLSSCFMAAAQNLNDSLLVRYHFNGNTVDISGNGWDGIASPNLTYTADRAGNPNYAVYFDGSTTYMDLPGVADLKPQLPVSFSFWVKADDVSLPTAMFTTDYQQNNYHGVFVGYFPDGSGKMSASFGSGSGSTGPASRRTGDADIGIQSGVWSHVVVVLRGAEDMDIYVNCTKATLTYSGSGGSLAYSTSVGSLGRHDTNQNLPPWYFKGAMDDFRYYNRVLNAQDVTLLCDESHWPRLLPPNPLPLRFIPTRPQVSR
jgi:hypothetical protein